MSTGDTQCIGSWNLGISLEFFADADYASQATDRRSVSGGALMRGGVCVCCFSRTQKCVTLLRLKQSMLLLATQ